MSGSVSRTLGEPSPVIHCRNLPPGVAEPELAEAFNALSSVRDVILISNRGQALVEFASSEDAASVLQQASQHPVTIRSSTIMLCYSKSKEINRPSKIPSPVLLLTIHDAVHPITADVIRRVCSSFGAMKRIVVFRKNGVQALVEFGSIPSAAAAKAALHDQHIYDNSCLIKTSFSRLTALSVSAADDLHHDYTRAGLEGPGPSPSPPRSSSPASSAAGPSARIGVLSSSQVGVTGGISAFSARHTSHQPGVGEGHLLLGGHAQAPTAPHLGPGPSLGPTPAFADYHSLEGGTAAASRAPGLLGLSMWSPSTGPRDAETGPGYFPSGSPPLPPSEPLGPLGSPSSSSLPSPAFGTGTALGTGTIKGLLGGFDQAPAHMSVGMALATCNLDSALHTSTNTSTATGVSAGLGAAFGTGFGRAGGVGVNTAPLAGVDIEPTSSSDGAGAGAASALMGSVLPGFGAGLEDLNSSLGGMDPLMSGSSLWKPSPRTLSGFASNGLGATRVVASGASSPPLPSDLHLPVGLHSAAQRSTSTPALQSSPTMASPSEEHAPWYSGGSLLPSRSMSPDTPPSTLATSPCAFGAIGPTANSVAGALPFAVGESLPHGTTRPALRGSPMSSPDLMLDLGLSAAEAPLFSQGTQHGAGAVIGALPPPPLPPPPLPPQHYHGVSQAGPAHPTLRVARHGNGESAAAGGSSLLSPSAPQFTPTRAVSGRGPTESPTRHSESCRDANPSPPPVPRTTRRPSPSPVLSSAVATPHRELSASPQQRPGSVVAVFNCDKDRVTEATMFNLFSPYGNIRRVALSKTTDGVALVEMFDPETAAAVVSMFNGAPLFGARLHLECADIDTLPYGVSYADSPLNRFRKSKPSHVHRPSACLHFSNVTPDIDPEAFRALFEYVGCPMPCAIKLFASKHPRPCPMSAVMGSVIRWLHGSEEGGMVLGRGGEPLCTLAMKLPHIRGLPAERVRVLLDVDESDFPGASPPPLSVCMSPPLPPGSPPPPPPPPPPVPPIPPHPSHTIALRYGRSHTPEVPDVGSSKDYDSSALALDDATAAARAHREAEEREADHESAPGVVPAFAVGHSGLGPVVSPTHVGENVRSYTPAGTPPLPTSHVAGSPSHGWGSPVPVSFAPGRSATSAVAIAVASLRATPPTTSQRCMSAGINGRQSADPKRKRDAEASRSELSPSTPAAFGAAATRTAVSSPMHARQAPSPGAPPLPPDRPTPTPTHTSTPTPDHPASRVTASPEVRDELSWLPKGLAAIGHAKDDVLATNDVEERAGDENVDGDDAGLLKRRRRAVSDDPPGTSGTACCTGYDARAIELGGASGEASSTKPAAPSPPLPPGGKPPASPSSLYHPAVSPQSQPSRLAGKRSATPGSSNPIVRLTPVRTSAVANIGLLQFDNVEDAVHAVAVVNNMVIGGYTLKLAFSTNSLSSSSKKRSSLL